MGLTLGEHVVGVLVEVWDAGTQEILSSHSNSAIVIQEVPRTML